MRVHFDHGGAYGEGWTACNINIDECLTESWYRGWEKRKRPLELTSIIEQVTCSNCKRSKQYIQEIVEGTDY